MVFGKTPEIAPAPPPQCFKQPESRIMIQGTAVAPGQLRARSYEGQVTTGTLYFTTTRLAETVTEETGQRLFL